KEVLIAQRRRQDSSNPRSIKRAEDRFDYGRACSRAQCEMVDDGGYPALQHLRTRERRRSAYGIRRQLNRLFRHLPLPQPNLLAHHVAKAPPENFQWVRMRIDQPRNDNFAPTVDAFVDRDAMRF